jgi:hypothetical protein
LPASEPSPSTLSHVTPASSERKNPACGPAVEPTWAYSRSGLLGASAIAMRPVSSGDSPVGPSATRFQVLPPSSER